MRASDFRLTVLTALVGLGVFLIVRGLIPAWTRIDTDFPNYYTAGRIVLEGRDPALLYDDSRFQEQITAAGFTQEGKFSPFPPATALLGIPLALLPPTAALQVLTILNLAAMALCIVLLARIHGMGARNAALLVLVAGQGLANAFRFGQLYVLMSATVIGGWTLARSGRRFGGGLLLGLFIPVKYYPVAFLPWYLARRDWRTAAGMLIGAGSVAAAGWAVLGSEVHLVFLRTVLGDHLQGRLALQDPFSFTFQSFSSLFRRLFVFDGVWNPEPLFRAPGMASILTWLSVAAVLALILAAFLRIRTGAHERSADTAFGLLGVGALLAAPATATYHMVLLWLPVALLLHAAGGDPRGRAAGGVIAVAYACIGFIPMSWAGSFDGGWTTPLAYPRLALLAVVFVAGVRLALRESAGAHPAVAKDGENA